MSEQKQRCAASILGVYGPCQCSKNASIERGRGYCEQHDPVACERKRKWKAESGARHSAEEKRRAIDAARDAVIAAAGEFIQSNGSAARVRRLADAVVALRDLEGESPREGEHEPAA